MEAKEALLIGGNSSGSKLIVIKLVARLLCFTFTLVSLITLAFPITVARDQFINSGFLYRYVLFSTMLGLVYSLLQMSVSLYFLTGGTSVSNNLVPLDFYGDLVIMYALATGVVASMDLMIIRPMIRGEGKNIFVYMGGNSNVAVTSLFLGTVYSSISLVLSSYDLYKRYFTTQEVEPQHHMLEKTSPLLYYS